MSLRRSVFGSIHFNGLPVVPDEGQRIGDLVAGTTVARDGNHLEIRIRRTFRILVKIPCSAPSYRNIQMMVGLFRQ